MEEKSKKLIKNTFIIAMGRMSGQLASFILLPICTRYLSQSQYGDYDLILAYVSLLFPLFSLQLDQSIYRELLTNNGDKEEYSIAISTILSITGSLSALILIICGCLSFVFNKKLILFSFMLITYTFEMLFLNIARGLGDNVSYSIACMIQAFTNLVMGIMAIVVINTGIEGLLISLGISYILACIFIVVTKEIYKLYDVRAVKIKRIPNYLKYSIPFIPNAMSWWINGSSDKVIIRIFIGSFANGILAVSQKIGNIYSSLFAMVQYAWIESAIINRDADDKKIYFSNTFDMITKLFAMSASLLLIGVFFFYDAILGGEFEDAKQLMPVYLIGLYASIISGLYGTLYITYGKSRGLARSTIISCIVNVTVDLILIKYIGLMAAPISSLVAYVAILFYRYFDTKKLIDVRINKKDSLIGAVSIIITSAAYYSDDRIIQMLSIMIGILISCLLCREYPKYIMTMLVERKKKGNL